MRFLALIIAVLTMASGAHADFNWLAPSGSGIQQLYESTTTTAANTSEQTLLENTNIPNNMVIASVQVDMTAAATLTAMNFKVYRKRGSGSYILQGTGTNNAGALAWTLATSAKGYEVLTWEVALNAGDSFKVTGTQTVAGAAFAIPYTVIAFR